MKQTITGAILGSLTAILVLGIAIKDLTVQQKVLEAEMLHLELEYMLLEQETQLVGYALKLFLSKCTEGDSMVIKDKTYKCYNTEVM